MINLVFSQTAVRGKLKERNKRMTRKTLTIVSTFMLFAKFGLAQADSISFKDTLKCSNCFSSRTNNLFPSRTYTYERTYLKLNFTDPFFHRPVYYNLSLQRDFLYKFNPLNPWNANDPFEAVMSGTLNYLFQTVDRKYLWGK